MSDCKPKWRGKFVFNRQDFVIYRYAESEDQAKFLMTKAIAKMQGVLPVVVRGWIKDHPGSYNIEIETCKQPYEVDKHKPRQKHSAGGNGL